jgi:spore coat protein A
MFKKKLFCTGVILLAMIYALAVGTASGSVQVEQTWLPGDCIPKFATQLPVFGPGYNATLPRVNAVSNRFLTVMMKEVKQSVLPMDLNLYPATYYDTISQTMKNCPTSLNLQDTNVWAYEISDKSGKKILGPAHWPGVTIEAKRFKPTKVRYVNALPSFDPLDPNRQVQGLITVDQSIHWADPLGNTSMNCMMVDCEEEENGSNPCCQPFNSSPPAVTHLHGAEISSLFDGGPEAWFTADGKTGPAYSTIGNPGPGEAIYRYPNSQEPGTLWFHDHALGATRTNVYSGMAAFYFIRSPAKEPKNLPSGAYEVELAIQTRQFDTSSQLFFPDGSGPLDCLDEDSNPVPCSNLNGPPTNPDIHPFWIPEFIGDTEIVNGAPWPTFNVEPRRYRFRILNGSNARFYNLYFGNAPVYQIGGDDNYLDVPVRVNSVFIAPGERADVIVDFNGMSGTITMTNDAPVPYPDGLIPQVDQPGMAQIMQFNVNVALKGADTSCNPAVAGQCTRPKPLVRLADGQGNVAPGVKIDRVRQIVLKEVEGEGGPVEVLVNNTKWDGLRSPSIKSSFPSDGVSELPREGSIELWEIINLTMDAHPMHVHLTQFQIVNRQYFDNDPEDPDGYPSAWEAAFPSDTTFSPLCTGGIFCPGYGPPLAYATGATKTINGQTVPVVGGNPLVDPYLTGTPSPPSLEESGWKDTAKVWPGQVLRILIRWAPSGTRLFKNKSRAGVNFYPFNPTKGPGYVWHCHIIDHEDNEMMRPYKVTK